jgi:imidazoleglycerol-phosphate dehydratase / histidinol-phosphatase
VSKILFIDRDGVLIEEPGDFQIDAYEKFRLVEGVIPALIKRKLRRTASIVVADSQIARHQLS